LTFPAAAAEAPLPELRTEPTAGGSIFYVRNGLIGRLEKAQSAGTAKNRRRPPTSNSGL
jgi:hypothetical protein